MTANFNLEVFMERLIKRDNHLKRLVDKRENGLTKVITGIRMNCQNTSCILGYMISC